jgi:hypothetical protein
MPTSLLLANSYTSFHVVVNILKLIITGFWLDFWVSGFQVSGNLEISGNQQKPGI